MNALEKELDRRIRKLLAVTADADIYGSKQVKIGQINAHLTHTKDGESEILNVVLNSRMIFATIDGKLLKPGVHYIDQVHIAVLELRKVMLLDDIADGVGVPLPSILEQHSDG